MKCRNGRSGQPGGSFYTITLDDLRAHLDALAARGYACFSPEALLAGKDDARVCALTFDDGTEDHHERVLPLLAERGWRAMFFVPTTHLDRPGFVTRAQLRAIADAGHIIGCHGHDHLRLDRMSDAEIQRQLETSLGILRDVTGQPVEFFAPPGGFVDARVRRIAASLGLRVLRTMEWGFNKQLRLDALECIPLNRHITPARLARLLDGGSLGWLRALYWGKEGVKKLLPQEAYFRLRARLTAGSRK